LITCHSDEGQGARYRPHCGRQAQLIKKATNERTEVFCMRVVEGVRVCRHLFQFVIYVPTLYKLQCSKFK